MARKRSDSASLLAQATTVADAIHEQDQAVEAKSERDRAQRTSLPLSRIRPRAEDTRPLRDSHVKELAESIGALGLIEPLVVDLKGVLLAGGHRLGAIQILKETNFDPYQLHFPDDLVPVRVMPQGEFILEAKIVCLCHGQEIAGKGGYDSLTTLGSEIDGDIADDRPIGGSIIVTQWSIVFTKNQVFDPMQSILNSPMSSESHWLM